MVIYPAIARCARAPADGCAYGLRAFGAQAAARCRVEHGHRAQFERYVRSPGLEGQMAATAAGEASDRRVSRGWDQSDPSEDLSLWKNPIHCVELRGVGGLHQRRSPIVTERVGTTSRMLMAARGCVGACGSVTGLRVCLAKTKRTRDIALVQ
jgi:hypothetical protein